MFQGMIASFNWDTSTSTALTASTAVNNAHLSDQNYNICIRRAENFCSICFAPVVRSATAGSATSFGVSAGIAGSQPVTKSAGNNDCTGTTVTSATAADNKGFGDYLEIGNMQNAPIATANIPDVGIQRICGGVWNVINDNAGPSVTICSFDTPFKVGVRFDSDESIGATGANQHGRIENEVNADVQGAGIGYTGFWLNYWQNAC